MQSSTSVGSKIAYVIGLILYILPLLAIWIKLSSFALGLLPDYLVLLKDRNSFLFWVPIISVLVAPILTAFPWPFAETSTRQTSYARRLGIIIPIVLILHFSAYMVAPNKTLIDLENRLKDNPDAFKEMIRLESTEFEVSVLANGDGKVTRTRRFSPSEQLDRILELDYYSSGGLSKESFDTKLFKEGKNNKLIPIDISIGTLEAKRKVLQYLVHGTLLDPNEQYLQITTINADNAFTDTTADAFYVVVNHETRYLRCLINFDESREQNPDKLRIESTGLNGETLVRPQSSTAVRNTETDIGILVVKPNENDQYAIFWEYKKQTSNIDSVEGGP